MLGHAQLEPHQLQQVRGLIEALIEPLARFSEAPRVDQLGDAPELRRERLSGAPGVVEFCVATLPF